jgi:hypothetical protein
VPVVVAVVRLLFGSSCVRCCGGVCADGQQPLLHLSHWSAFWSVVVVVVVAGRPLLSFFHPAVLLRLPNRPPSRLELSIRRLGWYRCCCCCCCLFRLVVRFVLAVVVVVVAVAVPIVPRRIDAFVEFDH